MTREEVEALIEEMGWVNTRKVVTSEGNNSIYILWINSQSIEIYLGSWFIEIETQPVAYPYKDTCSTRQEIIDFLLG